MLNFEKRKTITLIETMETVTKNELKVLVKNQLAGVMHIPRIANLSRCVAAIFDIRKKNEIKEIEREMKDYFDELEEKSRKHIKDAMSDNWGWIDLY